MPIASSRPGTAVCRLLRAVAPLVLAAATALSAATASAQEEPATSAPERNPLLEIDWQRGPGVGKLGAIAEIRIPDDAAFADAEGTRRFLEATENIPNGNELGTLVHRDAEGSWFVIFSFDPTGYVKDDDKDSLDAQAMLESIKKGTEAENKARRERGWSTLDIVGWEQPPAYDPASHNLVWAIRGRGTDGDVVNYNTRLLGRKGVMSASLVIDPERLAVGVPQFNEALSGYTFTSGNRYAEFRKGDKIAAYGLTALVVGGAAAAAAKSGLLVKFWKLIVAGVVGAGALLKKLFGTKRGGTDPITRVPDRES